MELHKLKMDEIRNFESKKLKETYTEIQAKLSGLRLDIYTAGKKNSGLMRGLRRTVARINTAKNELARKSNFETEKATTKKSQTKSIVAKSDSKKTKVAKKG